MSEPVVTFLFTDIEGSTRMWDRSPASMVLALERHDHLLRQALEEGGGTLVKHTGDGMIAVFDDPERAIGAAAVAQRALLAEPWPAEAPVAVRMAINSGHAEQRGDDYFGPALNQTARMLEAGHGGQILVSAAAAGRLRHGNEGLIDLGEHRLRDLSHAVGLFQLTGPGLRSDFPPLDTLETVPNNLPVQITEFVGREDQIEQLVTSVSAHRLVTLSGVGGVGKSRLAAQASARVLHRFPDGVWLVELAPVADEAALPKAVAQTIGVREETSRPLTEALVDALRRARALLVFDNCEHLVRPVALLAENLLRACPDVHVLATTREAFGIPGEHIRQVPPLATPPETVGLEQALDFESIALFLSLARSVVANFELSPATLEPTVEIVRRLDGIPLALELAAARLRVLSVRQIAERLDDRFRLLTGGSRTALPRHRTLQATMDWSHDLLGSDGQTLLRRLAVFQGGFELEAAERVTSGEGLERLDIVELLGRLVDGSMVVAEGTDRIRYRMLETVRQYAQDRLAGSGESDLVRRRHAEWIAAIADGVEEGLRGSDQATWMARLRAENDNLRAALSWSADSDPELGLRIAAGLGRYWYLFGPYVQAEEWLDQFLAAADPTPSSRRALAMRWQAAMLWLQGRFDEGSAVARRAIREAEEANDPVIAALARLVLGFIADSQGASTEAARHYQESYSALDQLGQRYWASIALTNLANHVQRMGDPEQSQVLAESLLAQARAQADGRLMGLAHSALAINALHRGDESGFRQQLTAARSELSTSGQQVWGAQALINAMYTAVLTGYPHLVDEMADEMVAETKATGRPDDLELMHLVLGMDALYRGEWETGAAELEMAVALAEENGSVDAQANGLAALGLVELGRGDHAAAEAAAQRALGVAGAIGSATTQLTALNVLALTQLARGEPVDAQRLAEEAANIAGRTREMQQLVRSAEILAAVAVEQGDHERSLRLVASAAGFREKLHIARTRPEQDRFELTWAGLGEALGTARLEAWQEEACGSLAELVSCCLEPETTPA